jgi:hypothetical protein
MSSSDLREQIALLLQDPQDVVLANSILGTADVETIASRVESYCREHLGSPVGECLAFTQSVGSVFALRLADGRRVVLKAHALNGSRWGTPTSLEMLGAVYKVQSELALVGIPCAAVRKPPLLWSNQVAVVAMDFLEPGPRRDPHDEVVGRIMAEGLAEFTRRAEPLQTVAHLPSWSMPKGQLFPTPHNALFDFGIAGGEWIDEHASRARARIDALPETRVFTHTDFSSANVLVGAQGISAIFDMDSVAFVDELRLLANTAVHFTYTGEEPWRWPSRAQARAFVEAYERARGRPFSRVERTRLNACAIYSICYSARCEHALDPEDRQGSWMRKQLRALDENADDLLA